MLAAVVGDLHCGSTVGLCPPDSPIVDGGLYQLNKRQEWLWACWLDYIEWVKSFDEPFALIVMGDLLEGNHHRTDQIITPDPKWHALAATGALRPLAELATKRYMIRGTGVHVGNREDNIGKELGFVPDSDGHHAPFERDIDFHGCLCNLAHHMPATLRAWTEATGLGTAAMNKALSRLFSGTDVPRVMLRAHRHRMGAWTNGMAMACAGAPWQLKTEHGHKVAGDCPETIGAYVLDWRAAEQGGLPQFHPRSYALPQPFVHKDIA